MIAAGTSIPRLVSISAFAGLIALLVAGSYLSQFTYIGEQLAGLQNMWGEQSQVSSSSYQSYRAQRTLMESGFVGIGPGRPNYVPVTETDIVAVSNTQVQGCM